jgi:hypothetical protein
VVASVAATTELLVIVETSFAFALQALQCCTNRELQSRSLDFIKKAETLCLPSGRLRASHIYRRVTFMSFA